MIKFQEVRRFSLYSGKWFRFWRITCRSGFIFRKRNKFFVVIGRQDDSSLFPVFLCLFNAFFSGGYKVPPDKTFAQWFSAEEHQGCIFFCPQDRIYAIIKYQ